MYKDDNYEDLIDNAINEAIANLAMEGFVITDEERKELKEEFLSNYNIKILSMKKRGNKNDRWMG